jgi:hypothetical protein
MTGALKIETAELGRSTTRDTYSKAEPAVHARVVARTRED